MSSVKVKVKVDVKVKVKVDVVVSELSEMTFCHDVYDEALVYGVHKAVVIRARDAPADVGENAVAEVFLRAWLEMSEVFCKERALVVGAKVLPNLLLRCDAFHCRKFFLL